MKQNLAVTFVLPLLNETTSLRATVEAITSLAGEQLCEVLIVTSPRSTAESLAIAGQLQQQRPALLRLYAQRLPGLGGALQEAFAEARGAHLMLMASDLETDPQAIPLFLQRMQQGDCDIVAGSRWRAGGQFADYGWVKLLLNRVFQACLRRLYGVRLTDMTYGYRLYRRQSLAGIAGEEPGHAFLLECLLKPLRRGARVVEVPCRWQRRREGLSAGSWAQTLRYVSLALRVRFFRRGGI